MSAPVLEARGVARRYGPLDAVRHVDITLEAGRVLALLGPSGSGKSTLVRLLHLLEPPDAGDVLLRGAPVPTTRAARLAAVRCMGLVQQRPGLLRAAAWENVAFPLRARGVGRAEARARALAWLDRLGLAERADAGPHELSGGEAQRVAIARALVAAPDIVFLDEATNQLDPEAARLVEDVLAEQTRRGAAVLLVTHSVAQARRVADRVAFLSGGRLLAEGPPAILDAPPDPALARFVAYA